MLQPLLWLEVTTSPVLKQYLFLIKLAIRFIQIPRASARIVKRQTPELVGLPVLW